MLAIAAFAGADAFARKFVPADYAAARPATTAPAKAGEPVDRIFADNFEQASIVIATLEPADGSLLTADALPAIAARFNAGADPVVRLFVDGIDVTAKAQIDARSVRYRPEKPLSEARHTVTLRVNAASASWAFTTASPPQIRQAHPDALQLDSGARPAIGASYRDIGAGIDRDSVRLDVNGTDVTAQAQVGATAIEYRPAAALPDGTHYVILSVADLAGHRSELRWQFDVGAAPQIDALSPEHASSAVAGDVTQISAEYVESSAPVDASGVRLDVNGIDVTAQAVITPKGPGAGRIVYTPAVPFAAGRYDVSLGVTNRANQSAFAEWTFYIDAAADYGIEIKAPAADAVVLGERIVVQTRVRSSRAQPESVTVNGVAAYYQGDSDGGAAYHAALDLQPGNTTLVAQALFADGIVRSATQSVRYDAPPRITVTSPRDLETFGPLGNNGAPVPGGSTNLSGAVERPVAISGDISRAAVSVTINQQQAQLSNGGTHFNFERFFLHEGTNLLSVNALDEHGRVGSAQLTVYVDQTAPLVNIEAPTANAVTSAARIDVRGIVNDAVEGGVRAPEPRVVVTNAANGQRVDAAAADRYYFARAVPLEVGANALTVTATDALGNARSSNVRITRTAAGSRRVTVLSGDRQTAPIATELAQPLAVAAFDSNGDPLAGLPLRFDLLRGSGHISTERGQVVRPDGTRPARNLIVTTDDSGSAQVWLTVGTESAESGNMLRVWNEQIAEDVMFTATGQRGRAKYVLPNGLFGSQYAQTDSQPLEPLTVRIMDEEFNTVPGTRVRYRIVRGDAHFVATTGGGTPNADGSELVVVADKDGLATARPSLGSRPGSVRVEAAALLDDGSEIGPAALHLVVLERQNGPTRFAGIVLDHTGAPLRGVRLSIGRTSLSTISDADGKFRFDDQVPPGKIDLFVDGRDVQLRRNGSTLEYPALHFETAVIQGHLNQLPHPIYLPPVDLGLAQIVGGAEDVTLTVPGYDGFKMIVKAGSVTFPDGSHTGPVVVTPVNADRLPMVPPGPSGSFGSLAWTLQPTGTRFDPPVEVHIPNTSGMLPGETLAIVQWDHDLATFVPMGRGTVDESGTTIVSDAGSGVTKAGWGGGPPPIPPNCGENPPPGICPARGANDGLESLLAACSTCGACKKEQPASPGNCSTTCVPKLVDEVRFTIDQPANNATAEIKTVTAEPDDKLFEIKVAGLDDDDSKTWKFTAKKTIEAGKGDKYKKNVCEAKSDAQPFSGASVEAKVKDVSFAADGSPGELRMVTASDAKLVIKGCGLKEETRTFKTKLLNPEPAELKAFTHRIQTDVHPGTAAGGFGDIKIADTLIHFMCKEPDVYYGGKYHHFKPNGMPILNGTDGDNGGDGGIGVLQVTDPDKRTCGSVWDWRGNIVAGDKIFATKLGLAAKLHEGEYGRDGPAKACAAQTGLRPPLPALTGLQVLYEAIRRNNGGRLYRWEPDFPYIHCDSGSWVRHMQLDNPPNPKYVQEICECETKLVPSGCIKEENAIMVPDPTVVRFPHTPTLASSDREMVFTARKSNELDVEIIGECDIVPVDGGAPSDPDFFEIVQNLAPSSTILRPNTSSPRIKLRYNALGAGRNVLAALRCFTRPPGRPEKALVPLRVLPPSFASRPAVGSTLALPAVGKVKFVLVNDFRAPRNGRTVIDTNGQALDVSLDGLTAPVSVTPTTASISSDRERPRGAPAPNNEKEFEVECQNTTNQVVSQTLTISHNGVAPGPVGAVSFTVTCAAVPNP